MKFLTEKFLLSNDVAVDLFRKVKALPIVDYHNHLDPSAIAEDRPVGSIARLIDHS